MSHRPHIINQFTEIVGSEIADKIACDFAGCTLYISTQKNSELVACVGQDMAKKLQQHFGNVAVDIPLGTNATFVLKKHTFFNLLAMGYTVHKAQQMVGIAPRTAWYWKREFHIAVGRSTEPNIHNKDINDQQPDLF